MRLLLLWLDRKIGSSIFLRHRFLRKIRLYHTLLRVLLRRIPPMSGVPVLPLLRFSGTFLSRPVLSFLRRYPSFVSSTHGVVIFFCLLVRLRYPSLSTHG